ncbi:MAG: hypothetical protein LN413_00255 [Candidatus Thermoplasmatota archaeon]|nr:hypothetical protein [Candidatus Thermoplasmatota archaeon]
MSIFLIAVFGLAVVHWIYEGIIAPSLRMKLRYELFALRDDLRRLNDPTTPEIEDRVYNALQESLNSAIRFLSIINLEMMFRAYRLLESDSNARAFADKRNRLLSSCEHPEVQRIRIRMREVLERALGTNSLPVCFYLLPLAVLLRCLRETIRGVVDGLLALPTSKIDSEFPQQDLAVAG